MTHGVTFDVWHLALFTPGIALPCALAYFAGAWISRRDYHAPIGWALVIVLVLAAVFDGILAAVLLACVLALQVACGYAGARNERRSAALDARLAALEARARPA